MRTRALSLLALLVLPLAACSGSKQEQAPSSKEETVTLLPLRAIESITDAFRPRETDRHPSAMYGFFVAQYLARGGLLGTALRGVGALSALAEEQKPDVETSFAILQELGTVLQTDVPDMLNRSTDRPQTLNVYMASLKSIMERAVEERKSLEAFVESLRQKQRAERSALTTIERDIRKAIDAKDYALAGSQQRALSDAQTKLSETEAELERRDRTVRTYKELLKIGEERYQAIEKNREVLIAGLMVVEIPGIKDLKILEEQRGRVPSVFGL